MDLINLKLSGNLHLNRICRLCLKTTTSEECISIFQDNQDSANLKVYILECFSIEVSKIDGLPPIVCNNCVSKVKDWIEFKQSVKHCDESLRQLVSQGVFKNEDGYSSEGSVGLVIKTEEESYSEGDDDDDDDDIPLSQILGTKQWASNNTENACPKGRIRGRTPKVKPYCRACNLKFVRFPEYLDHQRDAHGSSTFDVGNTSDFVDGETFVIYRCHVCKKEFENRRTLRSHCVSKHNVKVIQPYGCSHCDRQFPSWCLLVVHERQHTGIKPYSCDICGKENFISISSLRRHKLMHLKVFSCEQCGRDFNCDSALKSHIQCKHTDEKPFLCNVCGRSFSLAAILNSHMVSHSAERKYRCDICGFSSKTSGNHHRHRARHNQGGAKTFHCETCGKAFETKLKLSSHQIIHRSVRPHVCKLCNKGFLYKNKLERHILLVHAKERPYPCEICGRKLASKFGLGIHMKTHSRVDNEEEIIDVEYKLEQNIILPRSSEVVISLSDPSQNISDVRMKIEQNINMPSTTQSTSIQDMRMLIH